MEVLLISWESERAQALSHQIIQLFYLSMIALHLGLKHSIFWCSLALEASLEASIHFAQTSAGTENNPYTLYCCTPKSVLPQNSPNSPSSVFLLFVEAAAIYNAGTHRCNFLDVIQSIGINLLSKYLKGLFCCCLIHYVSADHPIFEIVLHSNCLWDMNFANLANHLCSRVPSQAPDICSITLSFFSILDWGQDHPESLQAFIQVQYKWLGRFS